MKKILAAAGIGAAVTIGSMMGAGTASAHALITEEEICSALDASPTEKTMTRLAVKEFAAGETPEDVATVFVVAALVECPTHSAVIQDTAEKWADGDVSLA